MIYTISEILTVLFECILVYVFFNAWFGMRARSGMVILLLVMAGFFSLQCVISLTMIHPMLRLIISYLLTLGVAAVLFETKRASAIYSALLYIALAVASEYLSLVMLGAFGFDTDLLMTEGNARAVYLVFAKTVQLIVVLIAASILRKNRAALTLKQILPLLPCLIVSIYICNVFFAVFSESAESLSLIVAVIGLLYINGIVILHTQFIKSAAVEAQEQRLALEHYEMQVQYYQNLLKNREETRTLWHDIKKSVMAIESMVESSDSQNAKSEYEKLRKALDDTESIVDVGNPVMDAILYHNIMQAKSAGIPVRLIADIPPEIPVSAVDLSIIIGNTFDNAIEECAALTGNRTGAKPEINVSLAQKNSMLFYEIVNPCSPVPHKKAGSVHGYGLINVRRCVDKYGGSMANEIVDGQYRVSIRLGRTLSPNR